ncbi:phage baseplate assembly protein [Ancylobacter pratisalsi]|uniref:Bacteriophage Mu Gp45 N-terminal domain-containing protein n=1 Tax=Ancylobacter pratisalsi TaxID=1745854 RepID=A0A6P1YPT1_9HYPH|nr:phage baseplate assembly protein [Ancylobacter pratisalsi]QIB34741.1 hypothetical protein G3A50_14275 [Ancylobacter pratisalsi]
MRLSELALQLRGLVSRALVKSSLDTGESQTVDVRIRAGHDATEVEVLQPFGFASRPPDNGLVVLLAVGGDQGDMVALPAGSPGNRLGNLDSGEAATHGILGNRFHAKKDGTLHAWSPLRVLGEVGEAECELTKTLFRGRLGKGEGAPRVTVTPDFVKLRIGNDWIVVQDGQIIASKPIIIGADPDPSL